MSPSGIVFCLSYKRAVEKSVSQDHSDQQWHFVHFYHWPDWSWHYKGECNLCNGTTEVTQTRVETSSPVEYTYFHVPH